MIDPIALFITLKPLTGIGTTTVMLTNDPKRFDTWVTSINKCYPIIKGIDGITWELGQDNIPSTSTGQVVIDDTIGSFGYRRKFSDLLQRYTTQGSVITLIIAPSIMYYMPFIGGAASKQGDTVTIEMQYKFLEEYKLCKSISSDEWPDALETNLGKELPLIIGDYLEGFSV